MFDSILLYADDSQKTIRFAAGELARYLGFAGVRVFCAGRELFAPELPALRLTVDSALCGVADPALDDAYALDVTDLSGEIRGSNERSVLLGCYRFLRELGYAFLRPDPDGERIPPSIAPHTVRLCEAAKNRWRGVCIEGAVSFENILRFVDWMPKAGLNTYFTQFLTPYEFFKTWYTHANNPLWPVDGVPTPEQVNAFVDEALVPEIKRRGMLWQAVGHGFNTETFGLHALGWDRADDSEAPFRERMALVDGRRGFFEGVPLNTNLCLSDPAVRRAFLDCVLDYLCAHPAVDVLHVWLADGGNNSCTCAACQAMRPSDWYVVLLNELDEALSAQGSAVRIVFLGYFDLLWPPEREKLRHKERFIFMFAPITRSYREPLPRPDEQPLAPFVRNRLHFPVCAGENMRYARDWQRFFPGDSFVYDYHYMWNHFRDWGDYYSARLLWEDLCALPKTGFGGYVSCQQTRVFAPTGLGMYILGQCLWGCEETFEQLAGAYYALLFPGCAQALLPVMERLSRGGYWAQPEEERITADEPAAQALREALDAAAEAARFAAQDRGADATARRYLRFSCEAAERYLSALLARREGREADAALLYVQLRDYLCRHEAECQAGFDLYWFLRDRDRVFMRQDGAE